MSSSQTDRATQGIVFNVQRYSVHDGGGIRSIVFLKGCPLRCKWCSNPESQRPEPELARNEGRCLGSDKCGFCLSACPEGAIAAPAGNLPVVDRARCAGCMRCTGACPSQALIAYGKPRSVEDVVSAVEQDSLFYARSGGGMTLSGGEPFMQGDFALALLREAKRRRIDTAAECCGQVAWPVLEEACSLLRELLFDIKLMDGARHKQATGAGNETILENLRRILTSFPTLPVCVRTPVIPGVNDTEEDIAAILKLLEPYPQVRYELLAYHRLGTQKYHFLGREAPMGDVTLDDDRFARLQRLVEHTRSISSGSAS